MLHAVAAQVENGTAYGAVSHCGGHLYEMIEAPEQEQTSDFSMGGIS